MIFSANVLFFTKSVASPAPDKFRLSLFPTHRAGCAAQFFSKRRRLSRFRKIFFPSFGKDALFSRRIIAFFNANATLFAPSERALMPSKRESRRFRRRKRNSLSDLETAQIYDYLINRNRLNFIFISFRFQNAFLTLCNDFYSTYLPRYRETDNRAKSIVPCSITHL